MNSSFSRNINLRSGFAPLVVTLSLRFLLTVIAVGLLSLSSVSLRTLGGQAANRVAKANARTAPVLALGELRKAAGDDRRITDDASIVDGAQNPNVVGVWISWSPKFADNTVPPVAPNYLAAKDSRFVGWLTSSGSPPDLALKDWGKTVSMANPIGLFTQKSDSFSLCSSKIAVQTGGSSAGAMAWTIVQDATRAKVNVNGPDDSQRVLTDDLQAQARPSLARSDNFQQAAGGPDPRADRVITLSRAKLDSDWWKGGSAPRESAHFASEGPVLLVAVKMIPENLTASWSRLRRPAKDGSETLSRC